MPASAPRSTRAAAGVTVGAVIQISELSMGGPQPLFARATMDGPRAMSTPIESGSQDLSASVTVVFELS